MIGTTLYKKQQSNGKTREWTAWVTGRTINVQHGLVDGQLQTELTTCTGKNIGRSNETTPEKQALLECEALYRKKLERDGYKFNLNDEDTKVEVTLARDYSKLSNQVPENEDLYCSYKIDGQRAVWLPEVGKFQSRKGVLLNVPHLEEVMKDCPVMLDGELYIEGQPLNRILGCIKKHNELTPQVKFYVFDMIHDSLYFHGRWNAYQAFVKDLNHPQVIAVEQVIRRKNELQETHDYYAQQGWEGLMIRRNDFPYLGTRAPSLYKLKAFMDDEFEVTGIEVDKTGQGVLVCGNFSVRMRGEDSIRLHQAQHPEEYIGRRVTVKFQGYSSEGVTTKGGIPVFPVAICFRDDV